MSLANNQKIRILIVEDHDVVRLGLIALFKTVEHFEVVGESRTVREAIMLSYELNPAIVLMDIRLPDGSGLEACREILERSPNVRVLFLTSADDKDTVLGTVLAGAAGYLLKEIDTDALIRAIETVAQGNSILDPKVTQMVMIHLTSQQGNSEPPLPFTKYQLTAQEGRILALVVQGKTNKEIGRIIGLSDKTVKNYLSITFQKLGVERRSHAAAIFTRDSVQHVNK